MRNSFSGKPAGRVSIPSMHPAEGWKRALPAVCRRLAVAALAVVVLGMLTGGMAAVASGVLRAVLSGAILAALLAVLVIEGIGAGMKDASVSFRAARAKKEGKPVLPEDKQACWHPLKAVFASAIVFAIPLLLCVFIAATAKPYQLPETPAVSEEDSMSSRTQADSEKETEQEPIGARIWVRVIVRMTEMAAVGLFGDPEKNALLLDRLTPLFMLLYPAAFTAGYCLGPYRQAMLEAKERRAAWRALRKHKSNRLADELTRGGGEVHYGHRAESEQDKHRDEQRRLI